MRVIFDIGHPSHVHVFKNLAHTLREQGGEVLFTTREKEFEIELLRAEGFPYKNIGRHYRSLWGKLWGLIKFDIRMFLIGLRFRPDLFISKGSMYAAHAAFLLGKKHLAMEDTGNMEQTKLHLPFTDVVLTPDVFPVALGPKQVTFKGYFEIAYLHPDYFRPDPAVYATLGLRTGEPYAIVRFVAWKATHDIGKKGLSAEEKIQVVERLAREMKVFISSEDGLPEALKKYCINLPPEKFHDALYYANLVVAEGATVASEAGVLGTPAIYINTSAVTYCTDQEKYGLVYNINDGQSRKVFSILEEVLAEEREVFRQRRARLLEDKENVTSFLYRFIRERYFQNKAPLGAESPKPAAKNAGSGIP